MMPPFTLILAAGTLVILALAVATSEAAPALRIGFVILAAVGVVWGFVRYRREER